MKDAKGHGSDSRGGSTFDRLNSQRVAQGFKPMPEKNRGMHDFFDYMAGEGPKPDFMNAASATAGNGPKSGDVPVHGGMGLPAGVTAVGLGDPGAMHNAIARAVGEPTVGSGGRMKMSSGDFAKLSAAVAPHLASTADPSHSPMRQRWDAMHKSGYDTRPLYKAGLNDDHIDTALRKIQSSENPKSDSYGGSYEGPGKGRWPKDVMKD